MSHAPVAGLDLREDLRRRWLAHAAAAFDLMFHPEHQADLITFDQRETRACELGRDLTTWLIQQHVNRDEMAHPSADQPVVCPKCGRPARRKTDPDPDAAPPGRRVTGLSGEVEVKRDPWRCTTCRIVFFPPGPQAGVGR
jgi:hypothetical protein